MLVGLHRRLAPPGLVDPHRHDFHRGVRPVGSHGLRRLSLNTAYVLHPFLGRRPNRQPAGPPPPGPDHLTIGILYMAVSTAVSMGTMIIDNVADVRRWFDATMMGESSSAPAATPLGRHQKSHARVAGKENSAIPGVKHLDSLVTATCGIYEQESGRMAGTEDPAKTRATLPASAPRTGERVIFNLSDPTRRPWTLKEGDRRTTSCGDYTRARPCMATVPIEPHADPTPANRSP